mmetsp:Transcript_102869/g.331888  ORF Transcript_102869/g.331888 Transcript_102869/m.331888 type:complete len:203 (+) Transcript_102869:89-697(+)
MSSSPTTQGQQPARPVLIYYYIPEDKDEADIPNAFPVLKPGGGVRLQDIRAKFPLPGTYHFRFKMRLGESASALWMDVTNEESQVPVCDGKIVAKVTRLSWGASAGSAARGPAAVAGGDSVAVNGLQARQQRTSMTPAAPPDVLSFDSAPAPPRGGSPAKTRTAWSAQEDMLPAEAPPPPPPQVMGGSKPPSKQDEFDMLFG